MKLKFLVFLIFLPFLGFSQYVDTKVISVNEGLFSNNVQKTFLDSRGILWIGSRAGLFKQKMSAFEIEPAASKFKFNNVFDICEDINNNMWVAGYGQGVLFFNKHTSKQINTNHGLVNNFARTIFPYENKIYVGTLNGASIIYDDFTIKNPKFKQNKAHEFSVSSFFVSNDKVYATTLNDGLYLIEDELFTKVSDIKKIFSSFVHNQIIYLGTEKELLLLNSKDFSVIKSYKVPNIWEFYIHNDQVHFISSGIYENDGALFTLENGVLKNRVKDLKIPLNDLKSFCYNRKNEILYIGTHDNGLIQINLNVPVFHQDRIKKTYSLLVIEDKEYVFHDNGLTIFSKNEEFKNTSLKEFKEIQQKKYFKYKDFAIVKNHFYPIDYSTPSERIIFYQSILNENKIWVSSNIGLFEINLKGEVINYHPIHIFNFIFFENKLITPVPYGGIRIFENINEMKYKYFHNIDNPNIPQNIVSIAKTKNAVYFASALNGLYEYKNGTFKSLFETNQFNEPKLKRITTKPNGNLIVITDYNDVFELNVSKSNVEVINFISQEEIKGSSTAFINQIKNNLYIGTNLGINVFNQSKYFFIDKTQGLNNYNLITSTVNNSKLYILTSNGFFVIDNSYFNFKKNDSIKAEITKILINNTEFKNENSSSFLTLKYTENNLNIFFTVINEKYPNKLIFKYRVKKSEPWIDLVNENEINLSYLNSGNYEIDIQIINEDTGVISIQRLISFKIQSPFYLQWPFIFLIFILLFLVSRLIIIVRIRVAKKELKIKALKNDQEKKELIFDKQLAEVKLQALKSQMNSHFLFNVLSSIQFYIIKKDVDNALYYLERFSSLIRKTLDFSDKKEITLSEEIVYLQQYIEIENIRVENEIELKVITSSNDLLNKIKITPLLLQPFIENCVVHAFPLSIKKPKIFIYIDMFDDKIKITIQDNGIGNASDKKQLHQSKGIQIVNKRLQLTQDNLKNNVSISFTETGTKVEIWINT